MFFFKQKTAYEMRISDWSSDVCSSDLATSQHPRIHRFGCAARLPMTPAAANAVEILLVRSWRVGASSDPPPMPSSMGPLSSTTPPEHPRPITTLLGK